MGKLGMLQSSVVSRGKLAGYGQEVGGGNFKMFRKVIPEKVKP